MMNTDALKSLAFETIQSPRTAAQKVMNLNLSRDVLWSSLGLVAVINAIIYSFSLLFGDTSQLPALFRNPILFFVIITGVLVVTIHAFHWTGRALGGEGDLGDLLALFVWLQALRAVAQAVMFFLILLSPVLAQLFSFAVGILGLWITINFISEAQGKPGLGHGIGVLVLSAVGIVFGLMLLVGLIGLGSMGVPANV
ncbi:YIP1 family protein [uncultured Sulfitobacter sp.]|uniref:YIP1 family protein n=1 Tax=uncultured Sulfitobacter sp. TaxID=191468 RepID=UPI002601B24F|nr:YIP1 family protein [uncultured Sulfitobacter sp.]